jgi:hypothetical protein
MIEAHPPCMNPLMNLLFGASMAHPKEKREGFLKRIGIETDSFAFKYTLWRLERPQLISRPLLYTCDTAVFIM